MILDTFRIRTYTGMTMPIHPKAPQSLWDSFPHRAPERTVSGESALYDNAVELIFYFVQRVFGGNQVGHTKGRIFRQTDVFDDWRKFDLEAFLSGKSYVSRLQGIDPQSGIPGRGEAVDQRHVRLQ